MITEENDEHFGYIRFSLLTRYISYPFPGNLHVQFTTVPLINLYFSNREEDILKHGKFRQFASLFLQHISAIYHNRNKFIFSTIDYVFKFL